MSDRTVSNLQWAIIVLGEMETSTIEQDRAISIAQGALSEKIDRMSDTADLEPIFGGGEQQQCNRCGKEMPYSDSYGDLSNGFSFCPYCGRKLGGESHG